MVFLYRNLKKLTNIDAILNTSFNLPDFPNVSTPYDAIDTVLNSGLEFLVLGNFVLKKLKINKLYKFTKILFFIEIV